MAQLAAEHWIGRLAFDIAAPGEEALDPFRSLVRERFETGIMPLLQHALDRADDPAATVRIGRVEVDLGSLGSAATSPDEILRRMGAGLEVALGDARATQAGTLQARADAVAGPRPADNAVAGPRSADDAAAIGAFLDSGILPWAEPGRVLAVLTAAAMALDSPAMGRLAQLLRPVLARRRAAERLVRQFPAALVRRLIEALAPAGAAGWIDGAFGTRAAIPGPAPVDEPRFASLSEAVRSFASGRGVPAPAPPLPGRLAAAGRPKRGERRAGADPTSLKQARGRDTTPTSGKGRKAVQAVQADGAEEADEAGKPGAVGVANLPVHAAGAVLLHPFLATLFDRVGLLEAPGIFRDSAARARAVLLVHHLATGAEDAPEPETVLPKLLCGLDFAEPVPRRIVPTPLEREQCEALLRSVIDQWTRLGRTSPAGLRESFLTRPGRLDLSRATWRLTVQARSFDMLLDSLPWTLSYVKTPFMPALLQVDWR